MIRKKYKTKQLISAQRGTLVLTCRITDYDGNWSHQEGIATDNNIRDHWSAVVHEAQLNAVYKHMARKNKYIKNSEDGTSVDTYVESIDVTDWYIIYYQVGDYTYKRVEVDKKYYTNTYRRGELVNSEAYKKGLKEDVHNITNEFVVVAKPKRKKSIRKTAIEHQMVLKKKNEETT